MELKLKYKYRLILDESWSFGIVGKTGRGVTEVFDIPVRFLVRMLSKACYLHMTSQTASIDILTGSMAIGLCGAGGFCVGSPEAIAHQRTNSPAFVFSAALPPLLAVAGSASLSLFSIPANSVAPAHPLAQLPENVRTLRGILDTVRSIEIPSATSSPLIHIYIRPSVNTTTSSSYGVTGPINHESSREELEKLLQEVVDNCADNGVMVSRTKRDWDQEMVEHRPSLRICVSSALTKKEVEKAGNVLKTALVKVLGKGKK